jgi:hypothetical protein
VRVEKEILSYLEKYGNTRENDLVNYGAQTHGLSPEKMKKILNRMAVRETIHRIVHNRLKPAEVYFSLGEPLPPVMEVETRISKNEVEKILEEAASMARVATRNNVDSAHQE